MTLPWGPSLVCFLGIQVCSPHLVYANSVILRAPNTWAKHTFPPMLQIPWRPMGYSAGADLSPAIVPGWTLKPGHLHSVKCKTRSVHRSFLPLSNFPQAHTRMRSHFEAQLSRKPTSKRKQASHGNRMCRKSCHPRAEITLAHFIPSVPVPLRGGLSSTALL